MADNATRYAQDMLERVARAIFNSTGTPVDPQKDHKAAWRNATIQAAEALRALRGAVPELPGIQLAGVSHGEVVGIWKLLFDTILNNSGAAGAAVPRDLRPRSGARAARLRKLGQETRALFVERFPYAFVPSGAPTKRPLKVGIYDDLRAALPELSASALNAGLFDYMSGIKYAACTVPGAIRIDLHGDPAGVVSHEAAAAAARNLIALRAPSEARQEIGRLRRALAAAIERAETAEGLARGAADTISDIEGTADHANAFHAAMEAAEARAARLAGVIEAAQGALAAHIVPNSGISDADVVNTLLGILDDGELVSWMRDRDAPSGAPIPATGGAPAEEAA